MPAIIELEIDEVVWKDSAGNEQTTPAHTFAAGTICMYRQTNAPIGWTKKTDHNNKALRLVTGSAGSGGSHAFSTVHSKTTTNNHTLTTSQIPSHRHSHRGCGGAAQNANGEWQARNPQSNTTINYWSRGSSGAHSHSCDMRVYYVDIIFAEKD